MERPGTTTLRIGDWQVNPASGQISRNGESARVEARTMRLLLCLAERAGAVVCIDDLLNQVWPDVSVSQDSVYQAVASLRRLLGDDPKQPTYIETVPRLGYRLVAAASPWPERMSDHGMDSSELSNPAAGDKKTTAAPASSTESMPARRSGGLMPVAVAALCLTLIVAAAFPLILRFQRKGANAGQSALPTVAQQPQKSIAVLPFLDLTSGMKEEEFADGMTEELIDRLSNIPGLRVPAPTSSFYFKGKQIPVSEIAKTLGVTYVLDGSVRKSGSRLRVAARLVRADNGYVIWSETYDRPFHDILMVQDDIAGEVTKALKASIEVSPDHSGVLTKPVHLG
jgi:TolB-like protein/DNA-binding winged helix-turn-helix (wHTH) protein